MRKSVIVIGVLSFILSLVMIISPEECIKVVVVVLGVFAIINGIYNLVSLRKLIEDSNYQRTVLIRGSISIVVGILALLLPLVLAETIWTVLVYGLAIYLLASAGLEIYEVAKLKGENKEVKIFTKEIFGSVIFAVILLAFGANFGYIVMRIGGIVVLLGTLAILFKEYKDKPIEVEAEVVKTEEPKDSENLKENPADKAEE